MHTTCFILSDFTTLIIILFKAKITDFWAIYCRGLIICASFVRF